MQMILDFDRHLIALNQAIKNHYEWSGRLLQISLLGGEPDQTILHPQAHKYCLFGHWAHEQLAIHQPGSEHIAHIHYAHTIMHDRARDMLYAIINIRLIASFSNLNMNKNCIINDYWKDCYNNSSFLKYMPSFQCRFQLID